jgi:hypothetical protein
MAKGQATVDVRVEQGKGERRGKRPGEVDKSWAHGK